MKAAELVGKTDTELKDMLVNLKKEAFNLRFQQVSGELEKTSRIREVRKDIARVKTSLNTVDVKEIVQKKKGTK